MSVNNDIITIQNGQELDLEDKYTLDDARIKLAELTSLGRSTKEIARVVGKSEAWVRTHRKDTEVVSLVKELQTEALASAKLAITSSSAKAAQVVVDLLDSSDEKIQQSTAFNILDRVGLKAAEKKEETINVNYSHMSKEELSASIAQRLAALRGDL